MIPTYKEQISLVQKGLASVSTNANLSTFKYKPKVLFNNLWDKNPGLYECRGHSYNNITEQIVSLPFRKSFNYLENNNWKDVPLDTEVYLFKKYNGFMSCASLYEGNLLVSTTGSTKSAYAELAKQEIIKYCNEGLLFNFCTSYLFEIVHPSDPHIIQEEYGVYPLGCRDHTTGKFSPKGIYLQTTLEQALKLQQTDKGEGFMMYKSSLPYTDFNNPCKLKSWYYRDKKKIMRLSKEKVKTLYLDSDARKHFFNTLSEEFKNPFMHLFSHYTSEDIINMTDQERRVILEEQLK